MPVITHYVRISNIVVVGGVGVDLNIGDFATNAATAATVIESTIAPSSGVVGNFIDNNPATEVTWAAAGGRPVLTLTLGGLISIVWQTSGTSVSGQIASATVEDSTDGVTWTLLGTNPWNTTATANTQADATALAVALEENLADVADTAEALEDNLFFLTDSVGGEDVAANQISTTCAVADTAASAETTVRQYGYLNSQTDSAVAAGTIADSTFTMYLEAIGLSDRLAAGANTTTAYADSAAMLDVIEQAINQIVADSAPDSVMS